MNHFIHNARAHYKRKEYREAIKSYDKAIARTPNAQLFDERAICHGLLGDLPAALRDAKSCIQDADTDPVGYLRAGIVLQEMDRKSVALEVMSRGLRRVKHTGQSYQSLRSAHDKLVTELAPDNSIDPLTVLPRELALMVLDNLNFRQIVAVMRVSKQWNQYIRSCPELWIHLDFDSARRKVRLSSVQRYVSFARPRIKKLTLSNMSDFKASLDLLLRQCPLEGIKIGKSIPKLNESFITKRLKGKRAWRSVHLSNHLSTRSADLREFLEHHASTLEDVTARTIDLEFSPFQGLDFPKMRSLKFMALSRRSFRVDRVSPLSFAALQGLKSLRHLTMECVYYGSEVDLTEDLSFLGDLEHLQLTSQGVDFKTLVLPKSLRFLDLTYDDDPDNALSVSNGYNHYLPLLKTLKLKLKSPLGVSYTGLLNTFLVSKNSLEDAPIVPSTLEELSLCECHVMKEGDGDELSRLLSHPRVKTLTTLNISQVEGWDDDAMETVARYLPHLQHLQIHGCLQLTGVGIKAVLNRGNLRSLIITSCRSISPDAIAWARSKKIKFMYSETALELSRPVILPSF